jgi:uncharacterized protein
MHPNAELIQKGFDAFAQGDLATLTELFSDDAVWVGESGGILKGKFEGKEAIFGSWAPIGPETNGTFTQEVEEIYADDRVCVAVTTQSGTRNGKSLDGTKSVIVFVVRDGKVVQGRVIPLDPDQSNDFWAA